ncbi:MAG: CBS domain-containing protein [bacterium]|nr:CBS domain-containing protein [bacterium]
MEVITTHDNVDFDGLASMIAASKLFPDAKRVLPGSQEKSVRQYLTLFGKFWRLEEIKSIDISDITKLILVDTRLPGRIGKLKNIISNKKLKIIIYDHHPGFLDDIKSPQDHSKNYGATITILLEKIQSKKIIINHQEATLFCLGLYEDTGSLSYLSTTPSDIKMAAWLLEKGADLSIVSDFTKYELSAEQKSILEKLNSNLKEFDINGVQAVISFARLKGYTGDLSVITHRFRDTNNLNVVFNLFETEERIHLLARSRTELVDVNKILSAFSGAGHSSAASASVHDLSLKEVIDKLLATLKINVKPLYFARDIMSSPVISVPPDISVSELKKMMLRFNHTGFPVEEDGKLVGMIVRQDIEKLLSHKMEDEKIKNYMSTNVITISEGTPIAEINRLLAENDIGRLPVIENGKLSGIVTRTDLIKIFHYDPSQMGEAVHTGLGAEKSLFEKSMKVSELRSLLPTINNKLPLLMKELLMDIGKQGKKYGFPVYAVGGFVRDLILSRKNYDLDIVVEGNGIKFARLLAKELKGKVVEHKKFQTAIITFKNKMKIDVATARTEFYEHPAALPSVEKSFIKYDLYRRDFSLNSLAINLDPDNFAKLLDYFGGRTDIKRGIIRVLYNLSFVDDPTRILRAVRFEQRYNFKIDRQTEYLLKNALKLGMLDKTAPERLREELILILSEDDPLKAFVRMEALGILSWIHHGLKINLRVRNTMKEINEVLSWFKLSFFKDYVTVWIIYLLSLVDQLDVTEIESLIKKFKFSKVESGIIRQVKIDLPPVYDELKSEQVMSPSEIYNLLFPLSLEALLYLMAGTRNVLVKKRVAVFLTGYRNEKLQVTGKDLIRLGLKPSPLFKEVLYKIFSARLNGEVKTKKEELELAKKIIKGKI